MNIKNTDKHYEIKVYLLFKYVPVVALHASIGQDDGSAQNF